ncbi:MAG: hypothetical protein IJA12_04500 [Oscillospiraceae bacterium]|nr:hypothetical protein [Oscillospiraceae bacterium]
MKKTLKKFFAGISAVSVLMSGFLNTVTASPIDNYIPLDDKGMFLDDHYYKMYYTISSATGRTYLRKMIPIFNKFRFVLKENVNYEEVNDEIMEIIEEYYPENDSDVTIKTNTYNEITTYTVSFTSKIILSSDDERITEAKEKSKAIMQKLNNENLISAFYDVGDIWQEDQYDYHEYFPYSDDIDITEIEKFIADNELNCTMQTGLDWYNPNCYSLVPSAEMEFDEYFSVAVDLFEEFNIAPNLMDKDLYIEVNAVDSLETLPASTPPAETIPTETTTTTVSTTVTTELTTEPAETTTVTTQPTTTSSSELTTTTTTITTITAPQPTEQPKTLGDADGDNELTVRDCSFIALTIAQGRNDKLSDSADFNKDGEVTVRDAAAIAKSLAQITN